MTDSTRFSGAQKKPPNRLPQTLGHSRIYILPTEHGMVFSLIIAGILTGSLNYNNNLGFLLSFLLGGIALVSIIHTYRNLSGIRVLSVLTKPVFSGDNAVFEIVADARDPKAHVEFAFADTAPSAGNISPDHESRLTVAVRTDKRGLLDPGRLIVSTRFPFGLFRAWSRLETGTGCLVYPKPAPGPYLPPETASPGHTETGGPAGPGVEDFQGLRAYQPGDPPQRIYWKSFSRGLGLHTKAFVGQAGSAVQLDWAAIKSADPEYRLSRLCDMVLKAHATGRLYGLTLPGELLSPGKGDRHRRRCLKALALYGKENGGAP